jgi:hypothetical protein
MFIKGRRRELLRSGSATFAEADDADEMLLAMVAFLCGMSPTVPFYELPWDRGIPVKPVF